MTTRLFLAIFLVLGSAIFLTRSTVASAEVVTIQVSSQTACSMNCIQIATLNGPWSPAVCSREEPLPRGANCRVNSGTSGAAEIDLDPNGCTTLRMRMFTIGQGLPLPVNLNQPLSDWVTFRTSQIPASFPDGENTMFYVDGANADLTGLSLWINDNYLHDDDFLDAHVKLSAASAFELQGVNEGGCR